MGLIESQEMMGFLDGAHEKPDEYITSSTAGAAGEKILTENPQFCAWRNLDRLLRGWITGTLSEEVMGLVIGSMKAIHQPRIFNEICDDFATIGKPVEDREKVFQLLKGLGNGFEAFVTSMFKPPVPSYKEVISLLQSHETMRTLHDSETFGGTNQHMASWASVHIGKMGEAIGRMDVKTELETGVKMKMGMDIEMVTGMEMDVVMETGMKMHMEMDVGMEIEVEMGVDTLSQEDEASLNQATQQNCGNYVSNSTIQEKDKSLVCQICDRS
ncbi:hypothetical protein RJ640_004058 [Escallonia rubra]|uniref:Uncharacterized protein n=1 Tax=Escallonia rubra TaxID=112253 RepID=A0AA88QPQ9_9ASTE|nr:hypothetical protein RJ640_004058 [Escallonia rubra]